MGGRNAPVCGRAPSARRVFLGRWAACGAAGYARQSGNPAAHVSSVRPRAGAWAKPRSRHYCGRSPPPQAVRGGLDEATPGKSDWPGSASSLTSSAPPARPRPHSSRHPFPPPQPAVCVWFVRPARDGTGRLCGHRVGGVRGAAVRLRVCDEPVFPLRGVHHSTDGTFSVGGPLR